MANKFYGVVGYIETVDRGDDVWIEQKTEVNYYGDILKNVKRSEKSDGLIDNITVSNTISIVADAYAYEHFFAIKYVVWMGVKWAVTSVEVDRPRLILSLGGVYNAPSN